MLLIQYLIYLQGIGLNIKEGKIMGRKRIFNKQFDLSHHIMYNEFPKIYTKALGVPGVFVKKINRRVHLKDGTTGEMDSPYIADPDGKILLKKSSVILEHQSTPVGDPKIGQFENYILQVIADENLPYMLVVASHLNEKGSKNNVQITPTFTVTIYFLDLGEENIRKRLSTVSEIINNNKELTDENKLNLGIITLYAPRDHALEITETVITLYLKIIDDLELRMEYTLYSVITLMIDAFSDEEKDYQRLKNMIDQETSSAAKEKFASQESILESLKYAQENLKHSNQNLAEAKENLTEAKENLAEANESLAEAKEKIAELEAENAMLKEKLNEQ